MAQIIDASGAQQQVEPKLEWYKAAADNGLTFAQWVNREFPTNAEKYGTAHEQILASEGIVFRPQKAYGIHSTKIADMLNGRTEMQAGVIVNPASFSSAALRTLFPSAILTAIEDKLLYNYEMNVNAFDRLVAIKDSIQGDKFERPLINFDNPTAAASQAISQLAEPAAMISITTSSISRSIPTLSIGMLISDQAMQATTLDLVSLAMARQILVEKNTRANGFLLAMLNGDPDNGDPSSLSTLGYQYTTQSFDPAITLATIASNGVRLSQKAWMKFLYKDSKLRTIDWVVTDIDGALQIENRSGKPTNSTDNPNSPRIDSVSVVGNPTWKSTVNVFITDDPNWPANTVMGLDSTQAIHMVESTTAAYSAIEAFVLRRAKAFRTDYGNQAFRLYARAFAVLSLTASS